MPLCVGAQGPGPGEPAQPQVTCPLRWGRPDPGLSPSGLPSSDQSPFSVAVQPPSDSRHKEGDPMGPLIVRARKQAAT